MYWYATMLLDKCIDLSYKLERNHVATLRKWRRFWLFLFRRDRREAGQTDGDKRTSWGTVWPWSGLLDHLLHSCLHLVCIRSGGLQHHSSAILLCTVECYYLLLHFTLGEVPDWNPLPSLGLRRLTSGGLLQAKANHSKAEWGVLEMRERQSERILFVCISLWCSWGGGSSVFSQSTCWV